MVRSVFLFSENLRKIYITLAQGVTKTSQESIVANRDLIRSTLNFDSELLKEYNELNIKNPQYNNSAIYKTDDTIEIDGNDFLLGVMTHKNIKTFAPMHDKVGFMK